MMEDKKMHKIELAVKIIVCSLVVVSSAVVTNVIATKNSFRQTNRDLTEIIKESTRLDSLQNSKIKTLEQILKYTNIKDKVHNN